MGRRKAVASGLAALALGAGVAGAVPAGADQAQPGGGPGSFSAPFVEPTIAGKRTDQKCIPKEHPQYDRELDCKPTAGSLNTLPGGSFFYWDALEGTENVNNGIVAEYGRASENDESRKLDLGAGDAPSWSTPVFPDGGANPQGDPNTKPIAPGVGTTEPGNDGALFCSDQNFLADGRIIAAGGTDYLFDPGVENTQYGVTELAGVSATRVYDPKSNTWAETGRMHQGRWYPTLVTLGDGRMFAASGVEKLVKPVNDSGSSGGNVRESEIFDPKTGQWTQNPGSADKSLPLFPRLHLLPDGKVFYNAAGQAFNPFGQDYAEATWNVASVFDPAQKEWRDLGVPGANTGVTTLPGFRGSAASTMLPLKPDADGRYTKASFLSAGGVPNPPSPGGYLAVAQSQIATVDTTKGDELKTEETKPLSTGRWYGNQTLLPTGEVLITSGADRDEVVAPGVERPVKVAELFDPATKTWRKLAEGTNARTYHNTAVLMPDGRVLVGGHAPISTLYGKNMTVAPGTTGPNEGRDPTFEIFTPPYLSRGPRPTIEAVSVDGGAPTGGPAPLSDDLGGSLQITTGGDAKDIESVVLVRFPSLTHLVDADQRSVELRITGRDGSKVTVATPTDGNVLPAGPYMLFVNRRTDQGLVPSVSKTVFYGTKDPRMARGAGGGGQGGGSTSTSACAKKLAFTSARATGSGRRLRFGFTRAGRGPVDVDVFQTSRGRRVVREHLVARFRSRTGAFAWDGRNRGTVVRDGFYFARFRATSPSGGREFRRVALERRGGRWVRRPAFYRRTACDALKVFKLERPVFGGVQRRALRIAYRLARASRVRVTVLRGRRMVRRFAAVRRPAGRTFRLKMGVRGRPRGDYRVRITVVGADGRRVGSTLVARRL